MSRGSPPGTASSRRWAHSTAWGWEVQSHTAGQVPLLPTAGRRSRKKTGGHGGQACFGAVATAMPSLLLEQRTTWPFLESGSEDGFPWASIEERDCFSVAR